MANEPRQSLTLRTTLVVIAALGCLYIGAMTVYVALVLSPSVARLRDRTETLISEYATLRDRVASLERTYREAQQLVADATLTPDEQTKVRAMRSALRDVAEHSAGVQVSLRLSRVSPAMLGALADAAGAESRWAAVVQESLDHLDNGDIPAAARRLEDADRAREQMSRFLDEAQRLGLGDMVASERLLGEQAAQVGWAVALWAALGAILLGFAVAAVRRRLYAPLHALDGGLAQVAKGDLDTSLRVQRGDEIGRLTAHFNQMTEVLRVRADADRSRQSNLAERFGRILEHSFNEIYVFDAATLRLVQMNEGAQADLGYPAHSYVGLTVLDLIGGYDEPAFRALVNPLQTGQQQRLQLSATHVRKDGASYPVELTLQLWTMEEPAVFVAIAQDVTRRLKDAALRQASLRISETALTADTLEDMFAAIHGIVAGLMPAGNFYLAVYDAERQSLSFPYFVDENDERPASKTLGRGLTEYVLRTGQPLLATSEVFEDLVQRGEVELIGSPSVDWIGVPLVANGETIGVLVLQSYSEAVRYREADLQILRFVSTQVAMAIARRRAEQEVADSRQRLQSVLDTAPFGAHLYELQSDGSLVFTGANRSANRILGVDNAQFIGKTIEAAFPALVPTGLPADYRRTASEGVAFDFDQVDYDEQGIRGSFEVHALQTAPGRVAVFFRDITERKRAEAALQRERDLVARIAETSPVGISVLDREGRITFVNEQAARIFGLTKEQTTKRRYNAPEWHITTYDGTPIPDSDLAFHRVMETRQPVFGVGQAIEWPDGRRVLVSINGSPLLDANGQLEGVVATVEDVTGRVELERQLHASEEHLRQAQKMESIGRLAGGVAHDFNNLLTVMLGFASQAKEGLPEGHPSRDDLVEVENACDKAAALTRQLLAFARRGVTDPRVIGLNEVTLSMDKMLRRLIGEDIELVTVLGTGLWSVRADLGRIQQVIVNLAVNARDAMPGGGKLTVETRNVTLDRAFAARHHGAEAGDHVMLSVSDTGHGMTAEVQEHIFEPFYTTKRTGLGTGLGLATCYGIVKQAGGSIWVNSEPGSGSTFKIYLPRAQAAPEQVQVPVAATTPVGNERILLVEDEAMVRSVAVRALRDFGYVVTEAANGMDALGVAEGHVHDFDILVTDVVMPLLGGRELAERLQALRPDLKVLYTSGYTEDGIVHHGVLDRGVQFLPKPYDPVALARRVRAVLDSDRR